MSASSRSIVLKKLLPDRIHTWMYPLTRCQRNLTTAGLETSGALAGWYHVAQVVSPHQAPYLSRQGLIGCGHGAHQMLLTWTHTCRRCRPAQRSACLLPHTKHRHTVLQSILPVLVAVVKVYTTIAWCGVLCHAAECRCALPLLLDQLSDALLIEKRSSWTKARSRKLKLWCNRDMSDLDFEDAASTWVCC